jgi:hypothetical protein
VTSSRDEGRSEAIWVPQEAQTVDGALIFVFSELHFSFTIETAFVLVIAILLG